MPVDVSGMRLDNVRLHGRFGVEQQRCARWLVLHLGCIVFWHVCLGLTAVPRYVRWTISLGRAKVGTVSVSWVL